MLASQSSVRRARILVMFICILMLSVVAAAAPLSNQPRTDRKIGRIATSQALNPLVNQLTYTVLPRVQIVVDAWVEYNPISCTEISPGSWTVTTLPTKGATATGLVTGFLGNGDCPGITFTFGAIFYTWTSTDKNATTDYFAATWTSPDFIVDDTVNITLASVTIQSADLVNNNVAITINGPRNTTASLTVNIKGANNTYTLDYNDGSPVGSGQYSVALTRPDMVQDVYSSIVAAWNASTPPLRGTFTLPTPWKVRGKVQNTLYIKVYEAACSGAATSGHWTFAIPPRRSRTCTFTAVNLKPRFASQTHLNGSGQMSDGTLIHEDPGLCSNYPAGANEYNTFYTMTSIRGACGPLMNDGDVAVFPSPRDVRDPYACDDRLLYVTIDTNQTHSFPHMVEDYCPRCRTHPSGLDDHVDNYMDQGTCYGPSLANYWEADLGPAGGTLRIPVSQPVTGPAEPEQASYRDSEITVEARKGDDGLVIAITGGHRQADVPLSFQVRKIEEIRRYTDRLVVVGDAGASVSLVTVINVNSGTVSDSFWAYNPVISPDGRFIAFVKFYPPHSDAETEDHEMIYDLTKSGSQNRPAGIGPDNQTDVGANIYPGNGNKKHDNIGVPEELAHQSASLLLWSPDSTKLVFADQAQGLKLVLVNVSGWDTGTVASASIMPLDRTSVCAAPLSGVPCKAYLDRVTFENKGLRAFFSGVGNKGSIHRELPVKYTDFVAPR